MIAFYPHCDRRIPSLSSDTLILIGERNDWTLADYCKQMIITEAYDYNLDIVVYPDACHSFDVPAGERIYHRHTLCYDEDTAVDNGRRVKTFLSEHRRRANHGAGDHPSQPE